MIYEREQLEYPMQDMGADPPVEFKDQKTGLVAFGILLIILGCITGLLAPAMAALSAMTQKMPGMPQLPFEAILTGIIMYSTLAITSIWLGIGSIMCRRWARALVLVISWFWLFYGFETVIMMTIILPKLMSLSRPDMPHLPEAMHRFVMVFTLCTQGVILVGIPLALVIFYRRPQVKATCEARDPITRWTDRRPLPILALTVLLACGTGFALISLIGTSTFVPFFGIYLTGIPATAIKLLMVASYGYSTYACHKLKVAGWWLALISHTLQTLSGVITNFYAGTEPLLRSAGLPSDQIEKMKQLGVSQGQWTWLLTLTYYLSLLAFMIYAKRSFKKNKD